MNVQAPTYRALPARALLPAGHLSGPPSATAVGQPVDAVNLDASRTHTASKVLGEVGKFVVKIPKILGHIARFVGIGLLGGLQAAVQVAAGSVGLVGMAGLGLAGALEIREGLKKHDGVKVLSGSGEIVRGAYTGLLSAGHLLDLGRYAGTVGALTAGFGVLQGGIHFSSGTMKLVEGQRTHNGRRRVEGMLEIAMGTASVAMLAAPITPLAVGTYAGLATARYGVVNWERIKAGARKAKSGLKNFWNTLKAEFRDEPKRSATPFSQSLKE